MPVSRTLRRTGIVLVGVLLAAGIWHLTRPDPVPVVLAAVERGPVEATVANTRAGTVKACRRAGLSTLVGGQVAALHVQNGQRVRKGQLLLELWSGDLTARRELAEAEARAARARAEQTCLTAGEAAREAARVGQLHTSGSATDSERDRAQTSADSGRAACRAAREAASVASAQIGVLDQELSRTRLIAPFDGVVAEVNAELHEVVTPSPVGVPTPPAVDLIDDSCLYVSAPIDEVDAAHVKAGLPARVLLDAFPDTPMQGTVRRVAPYVLDVEKQSRTVEVEVAFDLPQNSGNPPALSQLTANVEIVYSPPALLPGLSADVEVITDTSPTTLRVPTQAVLEGNRVLRYNPESGLLEERAFTPGLSNWNFTEALEGLAKGDRVVISLEREGAVAGARAAPEAAR
ncbi:MAG: efflux RND transporter periplasmic adaptor subunit [Nitrospirota bacterium]|nr:efflux RND transporter periplasmic adaptor subunit [Nitrospirota bacterium]